MTDSIFDSNSTGGIGGGILSANGSSARVTNTLLAGNTASSGHGPDAFGAFTSGGGNLIGIVDCDGQRLHLQATDQTGYALLSPLDRASALLGSYGGMTQTLPLLPPGSPVRSTRRSTWGAPATDQRGIHPSTGRSGGHRRVREPGLHLLLSPPARPNPPALAPSSRRRSASPSPPMPRSSRWMVGKSPSLRPAAAHRPVRRPARRRSAAAKRASPRRRTARSAAPTSSPPPPLASPAPPPSP